MHFINILIHFFVVYYLVNAATHCFVFYYERHLLRVRGRGCNSGGQMAMV